MDEANTTPPGDAPQSTDAPPPAVSDTPAETRAQEAHTDMCAPSDEAEAEEGPQAEPLAPPTATAAPPPPVDGSGPPAAAAVEHAADEAPAAAQAGAEGVKAEERAGGGAAALEEQCSDALAAAPPDARVEAPDDEDTEPVDFEAEMKKLKDALDFSNLLRNSTDDEDDLPPDPDGGDEPEEELEAPQVAAEPVAAEPAPEEQAPPEEASSPAVEQAAAAPATASGADADESARVEVPTAAPVRVEPAVAPPEPAAVHVDTLDVPLQLSELTAAACAAAMAYMTSLSQTEPALGEEASSAAAAAAPPAAPPGQRHMPTVSKLRAVASLPGVPSRPPPAALTRPPGQGGSIPPSLLEQSIEDHTVAAQLLAALRESAADLLNSVPGGIDGAATMTAHADALTVAARDTAQVMTDALDVVVQRHSELTAHTSSTVLSAMSDLSKPAIGVIGYTLGASSAAEMENAVASTAALAYNIVNCKPEHAD